MADYNTGVINDFRANQGQVGGHFGGMDLLLITDVGAKSGRPHTHPLAYTRDGDRYVIVASKGGSDTHPAWYHNLVAHPNITVEVAGDKFQARAVATSGSERERLYEQHAARFPVFHGYKQKTSREIPVFVLERIQQ